MYNISKEVNMTLEEYNNLKQKVINLRISAESAHGSAREKIWDELIQLEDLLQNAKFTEKPVEQNIISKLDVQDNSNIVQKPLHR